MNTKTKRIRCAVTGRDCKWPTPAIISERNGYYQVSDSTVRKWCKSMGITRPIIWVKGDPLKECDTECTVYRGQKACGFLPVRIALDV